MQLHTSRFGTVSFQADEVLTFEEGFLGDPSDRRWLLLADARHARLWWLQSIACPGLAVAVTCDGPARPVGAVETSTGSLERSRLTETKGTSDVPAAPVVLWRLAQQDGHWQIDRTRPIVLDVRRGRATELTENNGQTLQQVRSHQAASLRKSA